MGIFWSFFYRDINIACIGLDGAGKTSILYRMSMGAYARTMPTVGFNMEELSVAGVTFKTWDLGGQTTLREYWIHYLKAMDAIVYVVDSQDEERLETSRKELHRVLTHPDIQLQRAPLLVFLNKCDNQLISKEKLKEVFEIDGWVSEEREVTVCECVATTGKNVNIGFRWLAGQL
jgi:small GTP-binding protein